MQVYAAFADGVECFIRHATGYHFVMEVVETHVAGSAIGMGHHHDFLNTKLVDGDYQAAHG